MRSSINEDRLKVITCKHENETYIAIAYKLEFIFIIIYSVRRGLLIESISSHWGDIMYYKVIIGTLMNK